MRWSIERSELRQSFADVALKFRIAPRAARVVNTNRRVRDHRAIEIPRLALRDLPKWNADAGLLAIDVNASRIWQ
jgi:hypothetical protein